MRQGRDESQRKQHHATPGKGSAKHSAPITRLMDRWWVRWSRWEGGWFFEKLKSKVKKTERGEEGEEEG